MELTKKTTILFPPDLHRRLSTLARQRGTSLGDLVRHACEQPYGLVTAADRLAAVRSLVANSLLIGCAEQMARESAPSPDELLP